MTPREIDRRQLLKAALGTGGVLAGTALVSTVLDREEGEPPSGTDGGAGPTETPSGTTAEPPLRLATEYGTVVDALEVGADPTGEAPVNELVERHAADDTLLSFRPGTYRLAPLRLSGLRGFAIAAAGEEPPTFVPEPGNCRSEPYVWFEGVEEFLLDRISFDFTAEGTGGEVRVTAAGDATVRDVTAAGSCPDQVALFRIDVLEEGGTGLVENFRARNPGNDPKLTCVYVGEPHAGEIRFRNCDLQGFSDNGLYASSPGHDGGKNGVVHVEGGLYRNNNVANVRLGSTGSTATGVRIVADAVPVADSVNVRGIRLREQGDQLVTGCHIRIGPDGGDGFGGIVFHGANTGAIVRDTTIAVDRDEVPAIRAFPNEEADTGPMFEGLTIGGEAAGGYAALIDGRPGTVFRNCDIVQSGSERGGLRLAFSPDCEIVDSRIEVTGDPLVLRQSSAVVRNTTIVTPGGERYVDEMAATDEDFTQR